MVRPLHPRSRSRSSRASSCFACKELATNPPPRHSPAVDCRLSTVNSLLTPFFATLTELPQLSENTATLSPVFATLTLFITPKSFVCHSYTKSPGVWVHLSTSHSPPALSSRYHGASLFSAPSPRTQPPRLSGSSFQPLSSALLTARYSLFLYFFALFCTPKNVNSPSFNYFHTLCRKAPGCGPRLSPLFTRNGSRYVERAQPPEHAAPISPLATRHFFRYHARHEN
jgi:hypothetical protein